MKATVIRPIGTSLGAIIPAPVLASLGLKAKDRLTVSVEDGKIVLAPVLELLPADHRDRKSAGQAAFLASDQTYSPFAGATIRILQLPAEQEEEGT